MVECSSSVLALVVLFAINAIVAKEQCEECVPAEECQIYGELKKEQQQSWLEKFICNETTKNSPGSYAAGKSTLVCCPENIWGVTDARSSNDEENPNINVRNDYNKTEPNEDSTVTLENFHDEDDEEEFFWNDRTEPQTSDPNFLSANSESSTNRKCPISQFPPNPDSGCCGVEASEPRIPISAPIPRQRPRPSNWRFMPQMPRLGYYSSMRFREDENESKRKKRDVNETDAVTIETRIAGGKETDLKQFPWTVLLKTTFKYPNKESVFSCGGSLISSKFVLTAGHCVYDSEGKVKQVEVTLAEYDKRTFPRDCKFTLSRGEVCIDNIIIYADQFTIHPQYNDERLLNDIALIRLRKNAPYTDYIRPICLPTVDVDTPELSNLKLIVVGWGRNGLYKTDVKQSTVVNLVPQSDCKKSYPALTRKQMCAAGYSGEDTCKGDSGGPLMITFKGKYQVSGVVSGKRSDAPCGTSVPSLYTNVYQYVPWIRSVIFKKQT